MPSRVRDGLRGVRRLDDMAQAPPPVQALQRSRDEPHIALRLGWRRRVPRVRKLPGSLLNLFMKSERHVAISRALVIE